MVAEIIDVRLRQKPGQWFIATSEKLPGLFISHPDRDAVISDIPVTIKALYKEQHGIDVEVVEVNNPDVDDGMPWIALLPKNLHVEVVEVNNQDIDDGMPWVALLPNKLPDEYKSM